MGFGIGAAIGIGGSLLGAFMGNKAAGMSAKDAREAQRLENERFLRERDTLLREQRFERGLNLASAGASGLDVESFSDLFDSNAVLDQLDLENLRFNSELIQRGFRRDERNARQAGRNALIGGLTGVGTALLGSFGGGGGSGGSATFQRQGSTATFF